MTSCSKCHGDGKIITDRCRGCNGRGRVQAQRTVEVVVPPGVEEGATMQIRGEGNSDRVRCDFNFKFNFVSHIVRYMEYVVLDW